MQVGAFDGLVEIADLLNRATRIAARPGVRRLLQEASVTDPASRRLQAMLASGGCQPARKEEPSPEAPAVPPPLTAGQKRVLALLRTRAMSASQIGTELGITRQGANGYLRVLQAAGKLVRVGTGRTGGMAAALWAAIETNGNGNTNGKGTNDGR
jgi:hypothetical protein